jgi:hypothetical protein
MEAHHLRHILLSNPLWKRLADYKEVPIVAELIMSDETVCPISLPNWPTFMRRGF